MDTNKFDYSTQRKIEKALDENKLVLYLENQLIILEYDFNLIKLHHQFVDSTQELEYKAWLIIRKNLIPFYNKHLNKFMELSLLKIIS